MTMSGIVMIAVLLIGQYTAVTKYDPKRDADKDIREAVAEAQRSGRHVLLVIGGEWCSWCHTLDRYFESNKEVGKLRDANYVTVKVNWSPENTNDRVLTRYGTINTFPFFVVLDGNGKLLQGQRTGLLEEGSSYNRAKMTTFLTKWAPAKK